MEQDTQIADLNKEKDAKIELKRLDSYYQQLSPKKRVFLDKYSDIGTIEGTAKAIGVHFQTAHYWKRTDGQFLELFELAEEAFTQHLELELYRRALGIKKAKMSDVLLMFALKARRPDKYREKPVTETRLTGNVVIRMDIPPYRDELPEPSVFPLKLEQSAKSLEGETK